MTDIRLLLALVNGRPGITETEVANIEEQVGTHLPAEYSEFLKVMDGGEGFIGESYVMLWPGEELLSMNDGYEVSKYVPGLLIFGSDGGGEAYGFDTRSKWEIVQVPFIGMEWGVALPMGNSFFEFLTQLYERG